jgi:uncharacterized membrane protein YphA (DoxX/SURF4 family)
MRTAGRTLFSIAIVGFGVLCLGFVDVVHQLQPVTEFLPATHPVNRVIGVPTGVVLITAGAMIGAGIRAHAAAAALAAFMAAWIVLLQIPSAFTNPSLLRSPWWVRTFETVALIGGALIVAGIASRSKREPWIRNGRLLFAVSLPVFGTLHYIYAANVASLVPSFYPWPLFWAYLTATGNVLAGAAIATGVLSRFAATLAGAMYGTYALTLHIPRAVNIHVPGLFVGDPALLQQGRAGLTSMFVAIGMWGVGWIVADSLAAREPVLAEPALQMADVGTNGK